MNKTSMQAGMRIRILLVPVIALLLAPGSLVAQSDAFAGAWIDIGNSERIIAVDGGQLSSDFRMSGETHVVLKATVTGPRTAKGTWEIKSGDEVEQDYNIEMSVSADGREMTVTGTRIHYGSSDLRFTLVRPWNWKAEAKTMTGPILASTYQLGYELPLLVTESRPVALRIKVRLNDAYKRSFSIASVTLGPRIPVPGRYAADFDNRDNFYIYTNEDFLILDPELHAKEATFELPFVEFGVKPYVVMPKHFMTDLHVKLTSEINEGDQTIKMEIPIQIDSLFMVETIRCRRDSMPIFKGAKLPREQPMKGNTGDELVIPPDAGVRVQFLDGTSVVYFNRDDVKWTLTMGAGKFSSTDSSRFVTNAYEINALIDEGLVKGAESATDRAAEKGLEVLLRAVAGRSTTGLVMQISMFLGASRLGGEKVAVRLRSRVGVSLYKGGRIVVRNFAGTPEILSPGKPPLKIPVGFQAVIGRGGVVQPPEPFPAGHPSVLVWSGDGVSPPPVVAGAPPEKNQPAVANAVFAGAWHGTWSNDLEEKGADSLVLTEGPGGNLAGTWSGTIRVSGRRSGPAAMTMQGRTSTRSYQISGTLRSNILSLRYTVTRLDKGGAYKGQSTLTRTQ